MALQGRNQGQTQQRWLSASQCLGPQPRRWSWSCLGSGNLRLSQGLIHPCAKCPVGYTWPLCVVWHPLQCPSDPSGLFFRHDSVHSVTAASCFLTLPGKSCRVTSAEFYWSQACHKPTYVTQASPFGERRIQATCLRSVEGGRCCWSCFWKLQAETIMSLTAVTSVDTCIGCLCRQICFGVTQEKSSHHLPRPSDLLQRVMKKVKGWLRL